MDKKNINTNKTNDIDFSDDRVVESIDKLARIFGVEPITEEEFDKEFLSDDFTINL